VGDDGELLYMVMDRSLPMGERKHRRGGGGSAGRRRPDAPPRAAVALGAEAPFPFFFLNHGDDLEELSPPPWSLSRRRIFVAMGGSPQKQGFPSIHRGEDAL
jgi:hypothetical protein